MEKILALKNLKADTKILIIGFAALGVIAMIMGFSNKESATPTVAPREEAASVDTFIPKGSILIPIEIANAESLGSLIGDMGGVVDLYLANTNPEIKRGNIKVASRLKIIRAPQNPNQYAVLIKESESHRLPNLTGPFVAVVQNPDSHGAEVVSETKKSVIKIDYQN